jgi:site-specific recombinase XerC
MTPLQWDIQKLLRLNRDGSRTTQYQRKMMAFRFAKDIDGLGFRGLRLRGIGNRHVDKAVNRWKQQGLSHATIMNRLSVIRWLGQKINKPNLGYNSNARLGLNNRSQPRFNRAQRLTVSVTNKVIDPYVRVSFKLQTAFGLRKSEAMKIQPRWAYRGAKLVLKGSWTKGGRPREIPIRTPYQRGVLEEAKRLAGNGSMIPPHKSYKQHLHTWEHETRKAGLSKTHGLSHAYAQTRYYELTGWRSPMQGGPSRDTLIGDQRELDIQARKQIAEELGHARISITYVYLGR